MPESTSTALLIEGSPTSSVLSSRSTVCTMPGPISRRRATELGHEPQIQGNAVGLLRTGAERADVLIPVLGGVCLKRRSPVERRKLAGLFAAANLKLEVLGVLLAVECARTGFPAL